MSTSSIKRQIRRFYVVVVQWTSKKCTKKRDARAELLFSSLNLLFFWSHRRRRCCLSSLKWQIAYTAIRFNYCKAGKTAHFLSTSTRPVNVFFMWKCMVFMISNQDHNLQINLCINDPNISLFTWCLTAMTAASVRGDERGDFWGVWLSSFVREETGEEELDSWSSWECYGK